MCRCSTNVFPTHQGVRLSTGLEGFTHGSKGMRWEAGQIELDASSGIGSWCCFSASFNLGRVWGEMKG